MADTENKSFTEKIKSKYRLVLYNDTTYEEALSIKLSRLNVFAYLGTLIILFIFIIILLISYTPLRELIPRVPDGRLQQNIIMNAVRIDSLNYRLKTRDKFYLDNIKKILSGQEPISFVQEIDSVVKPEEITFSKSAYDSILRKEIEAADQFALSLSKTKETNKGIEFLHFFSPLSKGVVNNEFDPSNRHFGVDIVSELNEGVKSTLAGTVTLATWTLNTGNVIQVQHANNLISVYKHNAVLFKKQGDKVKAGEVIAIIGNSGEQTTGPHLHFELWYNGTPVNPKDYIVF